MGHVNASAEPARIDVEDCIVLVDAPGGAIVSLTAEAAAETAARLARAAASVREEDRRRHAEGLRRAPDAVARVDQ